MASWHKNEFTVCDERSRLDVAVIHDYLRGSYWAPDVPLEIVQRSIDNALCFGVFVAEQQVGFGRVITDRATFAYLADVFILEKWRGRGASKFLMQCIRAHPELQSLRRWMLATADAHGLYRQFGFSDLREPQRLMEIVDRDVYRRARYHSE
jgi:GNAT superfamily N-acetyltransferase